MKIQAFKAHHLTCELEHTAWNSVMAHPTRPALVVEVVTTDGISGWGSASGSARGGEDRLAAAAELLPGRDLRDWGLLLAALTPVHGRGRGRNVVAAIETALLDALGRSLDISVAGLLGIQRQRVPAYASGGYYYDHLSDRRDLIGQEVSEARERGFRYYKMKIGRVAPEQDLKDVVAALEAAGDAMRVAVDPNCAYSYPVALEVGRALDDLGVLWYEEPLPKRQLDAYRELREKLEVPIAGGEGYADLGEFQQALAARAMDMVQPDLSGAGGFHACLDVAAVAAAHGVACFPHCWADSLHIMASAHLLAAMPESPGIEFGVPPLLEYDITENPIRLELLGGEPPVDADGCVVIPDAPGLGVEVDRAALTKFATQ
jgi:D-galactarolactone cycloisomerase